MSLTLTEISQSYGSQQVLSDVNLTFESGELTAILGPSGSGKSTLLRVLGGLESPTHGRVYADGQDVTDIDARFRGIGYCFQHYAPFRHMTVARNIGYGLRVQKRPKAEIATRVEELLALVRLEGKGGRYPSQLSGGERQRMALARALALSPSVLLLDEPFGALDALVRVELRQWLRRLHQDMHVTTILVTHDQQEAMEVADTLVIMNDGRVHQVGTPLDCYDRPATDFVRGFLGPLTVFNGVAVRPHELALCREGTSHVVTDVTHYGHEIRVDFVDHENNSSWLLGTRSDCELVGVQKGDVVKILRRDL
jgi:sulfate transport system ATP-binding protein